MDTTTLAGTRLGDRYELRGLLGRGGMADVYDAVDERLDRPVAVKVLRRALADDDDVRRRFEEEARSAARLSHPNVVSVYDTGDDGGPPFIVMERLPGETLADSLAAGPVDQDWLRRVAGDVLQALAAAHGAGIVHRDIKPGNILIASDGCAKVADFGIAKSAEAMGGSRTATNVLVGTPAYLAPERIEGRPATVRSDLYSLGVVLYEALTGRRPFTGATPLAVATAIQRGDVPSVRAVRADVDPVLASVVERALARAPEQRFGSADEMRRALDDAVTVVADVPLAMAAAGAAPAPLAPSAAMDATVVVPAPATTTGPETLRAPARVASRRPRRTLARLALGLFAVVVAVALVLAAATRTGDGGRPPATVPSTTATTAPPAPATTAPTTPKTTTTTTVATVAPVTAPPTTTAPGNGPGKDGPNAHKKGHGAKDG